MSHEATAARPAAAKGGDEMGTGHLMAALQNQLIVLVELGRAVGGSTRTIMQTHLFCDTLTMKMGHQEEN